MTQVVLRLTRGFCTVALAICVAGCVAGTNITADERAQIIKGKTTKVELLRKFGNPDQTVKLDNEAEEISYIKVPNIYASGIGLGGQNTEFWFLIKNGVVQDHGERGTKKEPNYFK